MVRLVEAVNALETLYPLRYAEDWDHPGLIVGDPNGRVGAIHFAADPSEDVIDEALDRGANLIVTHHPLLFRSVHQVSGLGVRGDVVRKLYEHHCALWVGHTNADAAWRGVAHAAAEAFGLTGLKPLVPMDDPDAVHPVGLGRVGELAEPMTLEDFARRVAAALPRTELGVQAAGPLDMPVRRVAVLPGSGDSLFDEVRASGADVYVTSDLRHHPATDEQERARFEAHLRAQGIEAGSGDLWPRPALINTPHSAIESIWFANAMEDVPDLIERNTGERVAVSRSAINTDPWTLRI